MFNELNETARSALLNRSVERRFSAGETLWLAGDNPRGLAFIIKGRVRVVTMIAGRQIVLHWGEEGTSLGEVPFFTDKPYPATAIAAEPTTCLFVTRQAFEDAVRIDPSIAYRLLQRISSRVETLVGRVAQLSGQSVVSRLARFILDRATRNPERLRGSPFSLGMTQSELAEELGTVREVVVRSLKSLRESGSISSHGSGKYRITNLDELVRLAELTPGRSGQPDPVA